MVGRSFSGYLRLLCGITYILYGKVYCALCDQERMCIKYRL